jgi:hypothetical protein
MVAVVTFGKAIKEPLLHVVNEELLITFVVVVAEI